MPLVSFGTGLIGTINVLLFLANPIHRQEGRRSFGFPYLTRCGYGYIGALFLPDLYRYFVHMRRVRTAAWYDGAKEDSLVVSALYRPNYDQVTTL